MTVSATELARAGIDGWLGGHPPSIKEALDLLESKARAWDKVMEQTNKSVALYPLYMLILSLRQEMEPQP